MAWWRIAASAMGPSISLKPFLWFTCFALVGIPCFAGEEEDTPESRGRLIYREGLSRSGQTIFAEMGDPPTEVPASALPCVGCHGRDGRGRAEGGLTPADITWSALTKPYEITTQTGRQRTAYDETSLKRAIALGFDPGGNRLDTAMPRYRLSLGDAADLIAYLRALERERDPGLENEWIRLGILEAPSNYLAKHNRMVRAVMDASVEDINQRGGVYGRRLSLHYATLPGQPDQRLEAVSRFLKDQRPFALVGAFFTGAEADLASLAAREEIPVIGAFSLDPPENALANREVFYLYAGPRDLGRALAQHARQVHGKLAAAVVYPDYLSGAAAAIADVCAEAGWPSQPLLRAYHRGRDPAALAESLAQRGPRLLFFLGLGDPRADRVFLQKMKALDWRPAVLGPGPLATQTLLEAAGNLASLELAFPTSGADFSWLGQREYRRLAEEQGLPEVPAPAQLAALSAMRLLHEGLVRAGRELSRAKFIAELEGLYEFPTGYTPPLSFHPNRRIGSKKAYIVAYDPQTGTMRETAEIDVSGR